MRISRGVAAVVGGVVMVTTACVTHHSSNPTQRPHPVAVDVNNNLAVPTEVTVWVIRAGTRQMLGTVAGAEHATFHFTPINYSQEYHLVAERQLDRPVASQPFTIGSPDTGLLQWSLLENIIGFRDVVTDAGSEKP